MNVSTVWLSLVFGAGVCALAVAAGAGLRATPPLPSGDPGLSDGTSARAFESHYDQVFPARTLGIAVWGAIDYVVFREGRPGVVVGDGEWLYTAEEFSAPAGATERVEAHLDQIAQVRETLMRRGSTLIVALVPAKARLYPEHLAERRPDPLHAQLYDRILASLRAQGIAAPDLMQALLMCKAAAPVFLRTDTHWTPSGAACAARSIAQQARRSRLPLVRMRFRTTTSAPEGHHGDLVKFLGLLPWFPSLAPAPEPLARRHTEPVVAATGSGGLLDDGPAPQVVLVGTSYSANPRWNFTGSLQEQLSADVINVAAEGSGPFTPMLEYLRSPTHAAAPRLVIWEMPERYFPMQDVNATQNLLDPGGTSS